MEKIILCCIFLVLNSFAFTLNNSVGASFEKDGDEVKMNVASHTCSNLGITNDELLSLAEEAADRYWNRVSTSKLKLIRGSLVSVDAAYQTGTVCTNSDTNDCEINDSLKVGSDILISCNTNSTNFSNSPSVLGVTVPNNISGAVINGALILVNDASGNSFASKERDEKIAIIAHEIGHAVGLGHSPYEDQLMYYQSVASRSRIGSDDADGVTWLYPMDQPEKSLGCGSIELGGDHTKGGPLSFVLGILLVLMAISIKKLKRLYL